jgi:hypothetical protein
LFRAAVPVDAWREYHGVLAAVNANIAQVVKLSHASRSTQVGVVEGNARQPL